MSVHKYTSWGRTRSPKNIAGPHGTAVTLESDATTLEASNAGYKTVGYSTENQRFLHLLVTDANGSNPPGAITVFGYCHAFQRWFEIEASTKGVPVTAVGANTAPTAASVTAANSGRAENDQFPSDREYRVYEIFGIDRVAFVGDDAESNVYAACSTF